MLMKDNIIRITFSDTETTVLQTQQLNMIQPLSYKKLSTSKQQWEFQIFTKFWENGKFSPGWAAKCSHWLKSNDGRQL